MSLRHAILGFVDLRPTTGYELSQRFAGSVGSFWAATRSQIYRELHDLEANRLLRMQVRPQEGKPARKVYRLTDAGARELERLEQEPVGPAQLRDPFLLQFVFAAKLRPGQLDAHLDRAREQLEETRSEYRDRLVSAAIFSLARSPREALLWRLSLENGLAWCEAQLRWLQRVRRALAVPTPSPSRRRP